MVDFGSSQGRSDYATAGVVRYVEDCKRGERRLGPKDAVYGWALVKTAAGVYSEALSVYALCRWETVETIFRKIFPAGFDSLC